MRNKSSCSRHIRRTRSEVNNTQIASLDIQAISRMKTKEKICWDVRVHPRARKRTITQHGENTYSIHVTSAPSKGEANREVCKLIAAHLDIPISKVRIIRGHKSRNKLIAIEHD
jgi:uncharacterized protein (TIGR00251 family)